jgi:hypothetical protein
MSFDTAVKILSDLVPFGFVVPIANKVQEFLENPEKLKSVNGIVKLMDAIFHSEEGAEQLDSLT